MIMAAGLSRPSLERSIHSLQSTRFSMSFHSHGAESLRNPSTSTGEAAASTDSVELSSSGPLRFWAWALLPRPQMMGGHARHLAGQSLGLAGDVPLSRWLALTSAKVVFLHDFYDRWIDFCVLLGHLVLYKVATKFKGPLSEHWKPPLLFECWIAHSTSLTGTRSMFCVASSSSVGQPTTLAVAPCSPANLLPTAPTL